MKTRCDRLNSLAKVNHSKSYLEIGVCTGDTFFKVDVEQKEAVDPKFQFSFEGYQDENTKFFQLTSDEYFACHCPPEKKFDLIYLDGLHTFDQTLRDFCNSIAHSHSRTIWLIDDTCPVSLASAQPSILKSKIVRRLMLDNRKAWMGDVYKTVFFIHDFFPEFRLATFTGHGQTVVWRGTRSQWSPVFASVKQISECNYKSYLKYRSKAFSFKAPSEILADIRADFSITHTGRGI